MTLPCSNLQCHTTVPAACGLDPLGHFERKPGNKHDSVATADLLSIKLSLQAMILQVANIILATNR